MFARAVVQLLSPRVASTPLLISQHIFLLLLVQLALRSQDGGHMLGCKQWCGGKRKTADEAHRVPTSPTAAADQAELCGSDAFNVHTACYLSSDLIHYSLLC